MVRTLAALFLLACLPGCIAAIGNSGFGHGYSKATTPLLEERVDSARRILELRQQRVDTLRTLYDAGKADHGSVVDAEIAVEEARMRLLDLRAELQTVKGDEKK